MITNQVIYQNIELKMLSYFKLDRNSIIRMCENIEVGRIIKKTVRDKNQKMIAKAFFI